MHRCHKFKTVFPTTILSYCTFKIVTRVYIYIYSCILAELSDKETQCNKQNCQKCCLRCFQTVFTETNNIPEKWIAQAQLSVVPLSRWTLQNRQSGHIVMTLFSTRFLTYNICRSSFLNKGQTTWRRRRTNRKLPHQKHHEGAVDTALDDKNAVGELGGLTSLQIRLCRKKNYNEWQKQTRSHIRTEMGYTRYVLWKGWGDTYKTFNISVNCCRKAQWQLAAIS